MSQDNQEQQVPAKDDAKLDAPQADKQAQGEEKQPKAEEKVSPTNVPIPQTSPLGPKPQPAPTSVTPPLKSADIPPFDPAEQKKLEKWLQEQENAIKHGMRSNYSLLNNCSQDATPVFALETVKSKVAGIPKPIIRNQENMFIIKTLIPRVSAIVLQKEYLLFTKCAIIHTGASS